MRRKSSAEMAVDGVAKSKNIFGGIGGGIGENHDYIIEVYQALTEL